MTRYHKIFLPIFFGLLILIFGAIIYGAATSDKAWEINYRLNKVTPDSLNQILILPSNPEWKVNLTLDTLSITDKSIINSITKELNIANEAYRGRGIRKTWDAVIILDFKNNSDIKLEVVDAYKGICLFYTNTMGLPKYKCDGLKSIFETLANYKEPLGKRR